LLIFYLETTPVYVQGLWAGLEWDVALLCLILINLISFWNGNRKVGIFVAIVTEQVMRYVRGRYGIRGISRSTGIDSRFLT
jgi:hypothetical protein